MSPGQSVARAGLQTGGLQTPHVVLSSAVGLPTSCLESGIQIQILEQFWFCPVPVGEGPGSVTISASCSPQCVRRDLAPPCVEWWKL